jgi:uncharacterized protein YndB with AHSA1/START domain
MCLAPQPVTGAMSMQNRGETTSGPETGTLGHEPKIVRVPVLVEEAFRAYVELPMEWVPPAHRITSGTASMTIEPRVGGRFHETAEDGTEATRGTILGWCPPTRLVMTWRVGTGWQPLPDDEHAPHVEVDFIADGPATRVKADLHTSRTLRTVFR